jgi:8-oxo-dGTP pyrophosphatase MutT (NUDIX family)
MGLLPPSLLSDAYLGLKVAPSDARMNESLTQAAVLVPVHRDRDGRLHLTLIERSAALALHGGQIAFPGGTHDPDRDDSLLATALREAYEEIGLRCDAVTIVGVLPERQTYTSSFRIMPFVGRIGTPPRFVADPREVAAVFTVALERFTASQPRAPLQWEHEGRSYEVACVHVGERVIWGATLDIIDDLLHAPLLSVFK